MRKTTQTKWYKSYIFPLLPILEIRASDEYNTSHFSFKWLFFSFWTLDTFQFEIAFTIDPHWGIGVEYKFII